MKKIVKSITVDKELMAKVELLCATLNRNFSNYVESLLKQEIEKWERVSKMKNNLMELLNLSFNGRLKNYYKDDGTYHDYNVGDLLMVEDKRQSGDKYVEVGIVINKTYDENYDFYQLSMVSLSTGTCDYGYHTICGNLKQLDEQVIKHLPKYCIDEYLKESGE